MGMLERIKKRQLDGLKEFVQNMEVTGATSRSQIFTSGVLEDPIYMSWVMKNIRTFEDFMALPSDEINLVLSGRDQMVGLLAKSLYGAEESKMMGLESIIPKYMGSFKDELSYLKEVTPSQQESSKFYIIKVARQLQQQDKIQGFSWKFPPMDIFYPKTFKDGIGEILFENGVLAAEGEHFKGKRIGHWKHNYDSGKLLAEGAYRDGLKHGDWIFYYSNGQVKAQGRFLDDLKHGLWKEWDRSGACSENEYKEGVKAEKK